MTLWVILVVSENRTGFAAMKPMAIFIMGSGVTDMNPSAGWYNLSLLVIFLVPEDQIL